MNTALIKGDFDVKEKKEKKEERGEREKKRKGKNLFHLSPKSENLPPGGSCVQDFGAEQTLFKPHLCMS